MAFFGLDHMWWDLRVAAPGTYEDAYMATCSSHGADAFFLVGGRLPAMDCHHKGDFVAATIVHEVLEVFEWGPAIVEAALNTDGHLDAACDARHAQLDRLAWLLVPHVFPNLDPEEDFFEDSTCLDPDGPCPVCDGPVRGPGPGRA
jgi:hypothetical protein